MNRLKIMNITLFISSQFSKSQLYVIIFVFDSKKISKPYSEDMSYYLRLLGRRMLMSLNVTKNGIIFTAELLKEAYIRKGNFNNVKINKDVL